MQLEQLVMVFAQEKHGDWQSVQLELVELVRVLLGHYCKHVPL